MSTLAETKKAVGNALKKQLSELRIPQLASKKVSAKMRLEGVLESGAEITLACAEVVSGRPAGHYGLYWLLSLRLGPIYQAMVDTKLDACKSYSGDVFFSVTAHNLVKPSHHEVGPDTDPDQLAVSVCRQIETIGLPIAAAFTVDYNAGIDHVLADKPGRARNPFTTGVILSHLADRRDRIAELLAAAPGKPFFYDFAACPDPTKLIVEPIAEWFRVNGLAKR